MIAPAMRSPSGPDAWPKREDDADYGVSRLHARGVQREPDSAHATRLGRSLDQPNETGPTAPYQWLTFVGSALSM